SANMADNTYITLVDPDDNVAPTNFPIDTGGTFITRASHQLVVTGRDIAPSYADPDVDPNADNTALARGHLIPIQDLNLAAAKGSIALNSLRVDLRGTSIAGVDIANNSAPATGGVRIYEDVNRNLTIDTGDLLVGHGNFSGTTVVASIDADPSTLAVDPFNITAGTTRDLIVAYDCAVAATVGRTMGSHLQNDATLQSADVSQIGYSQAEQDTVLFKSQGGVPVTVLDSPLPIIRGFVKLDSAPSGIANVVIGSTRVATQRLVIQAIRNPSDVSDLVDQVVLQSLKVNKAGTSTASGDISEITLWQNDDGSTTFSGDETVLSARDSTASGWPSSVTFDNLGLIIDNSQSATLLVTIDVPETATVGVTVGTQLLNSSFVNAGVSPNGVIVGSTAFPLTSSVMTIGGPIISSSISLAPDIYQVTFSGDMTPGTGPTGIENLSNWDFRSPSTVGADELPWMATKSVVYDSPSRTATLTTDPQTVGDDYQITVNNATDTNGHVIQSGWIIDGNNNVRRGNVTTGIVQTPQVQPDCQIVNSTDSPTATSFIGNNVYNATGTNQTKSQSMKPGDTAVYYVKVQNDAVFTDSIQVTGTAGTADFDVQYFDDGNVDITAVMTDSGQTLTLVAGAFKIFRLEVTPQASAPDFGTPFTVLVRGVSTANDTKVDVVKASTSKIPNPLPDAQLSLNSAGPFLGNNLYSNSVSASQTLPVNTDQGVTVTAYLRIQNDGVDPDSPRVTAIPTSTPSGWTVRYFDAVVAGTDRSAPVLGTGFVVGPLNATQSQDLRVEITPDATVPIGEVLNADITATSGDGTKMDVVRVAVTNRPITKPDVHISNDNVTFVGNNIYNLTGVGQTVSLDRQNQVKAAYYLVLQNDGQNDDFLRLNAAGSGGGFTVQYFDAIGSEITTQVTGAGFTTVSLSQGASRTVRVEVTPDVGTASGTTRTINFTTTSVTGGRVDIARATINVLTLIKPDFEVFQPAPLSAFTGLGVIENSPSATQTVTQSVLNRNTATYTFNLRNMGNVTDRFKLTAAPTSLPTGWTITVRSGATDVLNGGLLAPTGFVTPNVGITATYPLTITMTPGASIPASATVSMVFTAESTTDISKRDTSKAVATVPPNIQPDGSVKLSSQPDASLQGNDTYNQTGSGQTVVPPVLLDNNQKAVFVIRLENDGNKNDQFLVRVDQTISAPGWTISFFDTWNPANPTSGSNINSLVISSDPSKTPVGWLSPAISPGAFRDIRCEVTPLNTTIGGDSLSIPVTLESNTDSALSDVVMVEAFLNSINQPDAMMRLKTDATYQFDDIYDPTGANETISTMTLANGMKDFRVRVQNDGNMLDTYTVVGDPGGSGWSVKYFEYPSGADITTDVLAGTYTLPDLAPKITRDLWFEVTPDSSVAAGDTKTVQLTVTSGNDNSEMDAVIASVLLNVPQADMIVDGIGDDVYDTTTSTSQVSSQSVDAGVKATYPLRIQNDGNAADSFKITGTAGTTGWVVKYFDAASGGTDITTKVTSTGGWVVTNLGGGQSKDFRVEVTPSSTLVGGVQQSLTVTGVSLADGTKKDIVRATTTVNTTVKPDLMVKKSTSSAYLTDNVYETTANPTTQVATQTTAAGTAVTYNVRLQNDGNSTRTFLLRAAEDATSGWTVKYTVGSSDITSQILSTGGKTSSSLAKGGSYYINITMTPTPSAADGSTKAVTITAHEDASNASIVDAVAAQTTNTTTRIPDLKIRNYKESTYTDTARAQSVSGGTKATYEFRLQNIGNVTTNFVLNATTGTTGSTTGWTVKYFNSRTGGVDITSQITGGGYTVANLIKLGLKEFHVDVTPDTTVSPNSTLTVDITAQNTVGTINTDTVSNTTTLVPTPAKPDMMIRGISDAAYVGNNVYNTTGSSQTKSQSTTNGNTATYIVNLENDGNQVSTFTLTGPAGSSGWTFTYTLSDNTDITSQVTSAGGYTTAALAGGANQVFYVLVQPGVTVAGGSSRSILVTAAPSTDATKKDTVMATTKLTIARQPDASIRNQGEATYTGEGSYDTSSGETQKKTQQITAGTIATYNAKVLNAGNVTENMRLKGTAGGSGWVVKYFNSLVGGTDITSSVTSSSGYTISSLTIGSFREFRVEVTAGATLTIGAAKDVILTASSTTDGTKKDIVKASTSVNATRSRDRSATVASAVPASVVVVDNQPPSEPGRPDVLIKKALDPDSEYRLDNVYQDTATGEQISVQMVPAGGSAAFAIKIENDGSSNRAFLVRAQESSEPGWKVLYKKEGLDLTELLVGEAGYITPELTPGESILLTVEMTPSSDTRSGTGKTTLITVTGGAVDSVIAGAIVTSKPGSSGDTTGEIDVALAIFGASPNPVERGGSVTFSYVITNSGPKAQNDLTLNLTWNGKSIAAPVRIPALQPGQRASGSLSVEAGGESGQYFVTGEVSKGTGETNLDNNKLTVKLVVK
ncbi:MAG: hypothetical protein HY318_14265, partial [Armatimonadetes bacterium]|nr:hypothetical protein [Armatimonadota bacterium]